MVRDTFLFSPSRPAKCAALKRWCCLPYRSLISSRGRGVTKTTWQHLLQKQKTRAEASTDKMIGIGSPFSCFLFLANGGLESSTEGLAIHCTPLLHTQHASAKFNIPYNDVTKWILPYTLINIYHFLVAKQLCIC